MHGLDINVDNLEVRIDDEKVRMKDLAKQVAGKYSGHICLAKINNRLYDLNHIIYKDSKINFLDTTTEDGRRVYFRSLSLLLVVACRDLFNGCKVNIKHSIGGGLYCTLKMNRKINNKDIENIKAKMKDYVKKDYPITCNYLPSDQAIDKFESVKRYDKAELLKYRDDDLAKVYECNGYFDYFFGYMFPSTGYIKDFDVKAMADGLVLLGPEKGIKGKVSRLKEMPKLSDVYRESERWSETLGIDTLVDLNKIIEKGKYGDLIRTVEALHEKKIAEIADIIVKENKKVILIAAPSSSGKTSFAHRLSIQLRVNGLKPVPISLDDYFVDREHTPIDEHGNYDFESIYAIDLEKFNDDLNALLRGEEIEKIKFDFVTGSRIYTGEKIHLKKNQPVILEGIHGLNPLLTKNIDNSLKFKIYISVITQVNLDDHNRIPTTDLRLYRRLVRDYNFRGNSAERTLRTWPSVRRGENKNIFPYQEQADIMFNSASVYELSVLKKQAIEILKEVGEDSEYFLEAVRLKKILQYFVEINDTLDIGPTSIIREFIGGSRILEDEEEACRGQKQD